MPGKTSMTMWYIILSLAVFRFRRFSGTRNPRADPAEFEARGWNSGGPKGDTKLG